MRSLLVLTILLISVAVNAETYTVNISPKAYNRIVLPVPPSRVVIPPDAEFVERPMLHNNDTGLLLKPVDGAADTTILIELETGESFSLLLKTDDELEVGAVFRYRDASDFSNKPKREERPSDGFIAKTIEAAYRGEVPEGMGEVAGLAPIVLRVDKTETECNCHAELRLNPINKYRGSQHEVSVYRLSSNKLLAIDPRDFWRKGVVAVMIEDDVVSKGAFPMMIIMESIND